MYPVSTNALLNGTDSDCGRTCFWLQAVTVPVALCGLLLSSVWLLMLVIKYRRNPEVFDIGLILMQLAHVSFCLAALSYACFELRLRGQTREAAFTSNSSFATVYIWFLISACVKNFWTASTSLFRLFAIARPLQFRQWLTGRTQVRCFALVTVMSVSMVSGAVVSWQITKVNSETFLVRIFLPITRTPQTYLPVPLILLTSAITVLQLVSARANRPGENVSNFSATASRGFQGAANANATPAAYSGSALDAALAAVAASRSAAQAAADAAACNVPVMSSDAAEDNILTAADSAAADAAAAARAAGAANEQAAVAAAAARAHPGSGVTNANDAVLAAASAAATFASATKIFGKKPNFKTAASAAAAAAAAAVSWATAASEFATEAEVASNAAAKAAVAALGAASSTRADEVSAAAASSAASAAAAAAATSATVASVLAAKAFVTAAAAAAAAAASDSNDFDVDMAAIAASVYSTTAEDLAVAEAMAKAVEAAAATADAADKAAAKIGDPANANAADSAASAAAAAAASAASNSNAAGVAAAAAAATNSNAVASAASESARRNYRNTILIVSLSAIAITASELPGGILVILRPNHSLPYWLVPLDDLLVTAQSVAHFAIFYAFSASFRAHLGQLCSRRANLRVGLSGDPASGSRQQEMRPLVRGRN